MTKLAIFMIALSSMFFHEQDVFAGLIGCNVNPNLAWCECDKYPQECAPLPRFESEGKNLQIPTTATGIELNTPWKVKIYDFAKINVIHPAWGIGHSERDYHTTDRLAHKQNISLDTDVLFATAFLHDLGGIGSFQKPGVDHAVRSAEIVGPLLESFNFPKNKISAVKQMILGHTYYGPMPKSRADQLFRDADILDFLGTIGIARVLAITEDPINSGDLGSTVKLLNSFVAELPLKLSSPLAQQMAQPRIEEMKRFFKSLGIYTYGGAAL